MPELRSEQKSLPPGVDGGEYYNFPGDGSYGLFTYILPYVEQEALFQAIDFSLGAWEYQQGSQKGTVGDQFMRTVLPVYTCPSNPDIKIGEVMGNFYGAVSNYAGCAGTKWTASDNANKSSSDPNTYTPTTDVESSGTESAIARNGLFQWGGEIEMGSCRDGLSNTFLILETTPAKVGDEPQYRWYRNGISNGLVLSRNWLLGANRIGKALYAARMLQVPMNRLPSSNLGGALFNDQPVGSQHPGGGNFAKGDGSVSFVSESIDFYIYRSMATRDGGEVLFGQPE